MAQSKICTTCGTQYPPGRTPDICDICSDERQYVPSEEGQSWTTHKQLIKNHSVQIQKLDDNIYELKMLPDFAIGERALLILSDQGNILWDCFALLDASTIAFIKSKGGLDAIAFSHPHYYTTMNHWATTFDCPIYIHQKDEEWIMFDGKHIRLWEGNEKPLWNDMRLINIGGHFPGSSLLHAPSLSPKGSVFCGDTLFIAPSKQFISVMYSYPNRIPLSRGELRQIKKRFKTLDFDTLYGFWSYQNISENAKSILNKSLEQHLQ